MLVARHIRRGKLVSFSLLSDIKASQLVPQVLEQTRCSTSWPSHLKDDPENYDPDRPTTPWVRSVISGVDLMRNPKYNKGLAFSDVERDRLYLRGLLPPAVISQEVQAERAMVNLRSMRSDLEKHTYLSSLQDRNERLFFHVLSENIAELMPIVHQPTVSLYCQTYGLMFRSLPRGLFITLEDKGSVFQILKNWPERRVKAICITDGERVGSMGDLGVQAVGVPVSKLALYTAGGGIPPSMCLPVVIDAGTDNEELLKNPFYVGMRHRRIRGDAYMQLLDEFLTAAKRRFGNNILVHFEGMTYDNMEKLLSTYRGSFPCFNDDAQGTAAVMIAGILAAQRLTGKSLSEHTYLFAGEGPAVTAIAQMVAATIARDGLLRGTPLDDARQNMWLVDSKGLVTRGRGDSGSLDDRQLPFCHDSPAHCPDLQSAVATIKPSVLVGLSSSGNPVFTFTKEVCEAMAANHERPMILPLSMPTAEASAHDAYAWTGGRCLFADRTRRADDPLVTLEDGRTFRPGMLQTAYIFPGIGLGTIMSRSTRLRDQMLFAAAEALAKLVTDEHRAEGAIFPPISDLRNISAHVAKAVAQKAYDAGVATQLPKPPDLLQTAFKFMYRSSYRNYR